jgi:hypothetical protein
MGLRPRPGFLRQLFRRFSILEITVQEPAQDNSYNQCKKDQEGTRHGYAPEQKTDLDGRDILNDKYHGKTCKDNDQNQFKTHFSSSPDELRKPAFAGCECALAHIIIAKRWNCQLKCCFNG